MKTGIVRKPDELFRMVLPAEMRRVLHINENTSLEIYVEDGAICYRPYRLQCVCCGNTNEESHVVHRGVHVCPTCLAEFKER